MRLNCKRGHWFFLTKVELGRGGTLGEVVLHSGVGVEAGCGTGVEVSLTIRLSNDNIKIAHVSDQRYV